MNSYAYKHHMITTVELLEEIKKKNGIKSKYGLAKFIGCSRPAVDNWLEGEVISESRALELADLADIDPGYVLYSVAAERAKKKGNERLFNFWKERADQIGPALLSLIPCILWISSDLSPLV